MDKLAGEDGDLWGEENEEDEILEWLLFMFWELKCFKTACNLESGEENPMHDLKRFPDLMFADVESFAKESLRCTSESKAYKLTHTSSSKTRTFDCVAVKILEPDVISGIRFEVDTDNMLLI